MKVFFNRGIPLNRDTVAHLKEHGVVILKDRPLQEKRGIVINHGNSSTRINAPIIINHPEFIYQTACREAARRCGDLMPDVRLNYKDTNYIPLIAKQDGMKGRGKKVILTVEDCLDPTFVPGDYAIFQRFIEPPSLEYRVVVFRGQFVIAYKKEIEDKTNPAAFKNFRICEEGQHYKGLPERVINLAIEAASRFDLDLLGVDLIYPGDKLNGQDGYVLEVNSAPGFGTQFTLPRVLAMIHQSCES